MVTRNAQIAKLAAAAAFVFVGKVVKLKAATMASLAAANTVVVEVERVLSAPEMFRAMAGQHLTARLAKGVVLARGARKTFFANGWVFGASLAVDVIGTSDVIDAAAMTPRLRAAQGTAQDEAISARLAAATMGVAGTVKAVERSARQASHISEHDPDWHEATIRVDEVVKGKKDVKEVTVLFPASDDTRWHQVGKYATGQQGIFMLHGGASKASRQGVPAKLLAAVPSGPDVFTTLHPQDTLPLQDLERVRALARK